MRSTRSSANSESGSHLLGRLSSPSTSTRIRTCPPLYRGRNVVCAEFEHGGSDLVDGLAVFSVSDRGAQSEGLSFVAHAESNLCRVARSASGRSGLTTVGPMYFKT